MGQLDFAWGMRSITPRKHLFKIDTFKLSKQGELRLKWMEYYEERKNASLTFRHFGISEKTFWKWHKRYKQSGLIGLEDRSRRPIRARTRSIPKPVIEAILKVRQTHPEWSKYKIQAALIDVYRLNTSLSSIGRILLDHNLILPRDTKKRRKATLSPALRVSRSLKLTVTYPGAVVHIDTKHLYMPGGVRAYHFTAIDAYSRFKHARTFSSGSSRSARFFFLEFMDMFKYEVRAVISDNGSEYKGEFHLLLESRNIAHYFTYPYSPKQNAIVERAIRTDIEEFYHNGGLKLTIKEQNMALTAWNYYYNNIRYHRSLNCLTPARFLDKFNQLNPYLCTEP